MRLSLRRVFASALLGTLVTAVMGLKAPGPTAAIAFRDISGLSRFAYRSNNDFRGRKYFPQPMCGGVAVLDFDRDGRLDLFFTNGARLPELKKVDSSFHNCLLRNIGGERFEDATEQAGLSGADLDFCFGVAAGDYDNDGLTDLFICNAGRNALYHNTGKGKFTNVTAGSGLDRKPPDLLSVCAAWLDFDDDGLLDLVVSQYTFWNPNTDVRCVRDGKEDSYCHPRTYRAVPHNLYRSLGNGKFEDVTEASGLSTALGKGMGIGIADFNRDGKMDIFVANDTERNFLYLNKGGSRFEEEGLLYGVAYNEQGITVSGMGCDVNDYNNDGWVDVFYNNLQTQIFALFRNQQGTFFEYVSPVSGVERLSRRYSGWSNGFIDYNNDGWKDIYSSNGDVDYFPPNAEQHDTLFENQNGERFVDVSESLGSDFNRMGFQRGSAFLDLNQDGFLDLVVTSLNQAPRIMLNSGGNGNHWLRVELAGKKSNRDAIGAQAKVTTGAGRTLFNHVNPSVGFMSSSEKTLHFGLGGETIVKSVEIRWPSGKIQQVTEVRADNVLKLEEPQ